MYHYLTIIYIFYSVHDELKQTISIQKNKLVSNQLIGR